MDFHLYRFVYWQNFTFLHSDKRPKHLILASNWVRFNKKDFLRRFWFLVISLEIRETGYRLSPVCIKV